jgi:hypothetical protein
MQMIIHSGARKKLILGVGNEGDFAMHAMSHSACSIDRCPASARPLQGLIIFRRAPILLPCDLTLSARWH